MRHPIVASLLLAAFGSACGTVVLPPAAVPARQIPALVIDETPPAEGTTRVVLDVVEGPSRVELVTEQHSTATPPAVALGVVGADVAAVTVVPQGPVDSISTRLLCISPCVVDLPAGTYELNFAGPHDTGGRRVPSGLGLLQVTRDPVVYRRAIGFYSPADQAEAYLGNLSLIVGISLAVIGTVALATQDSEGVPPLGAALGMLGGGVGLSVLGGYWALDARAVLQPGAEIQFPLR
jgi:hypothetical protein